MQSRKLLAACAALILLLAACTAEPPNRSLPDPQTPEEVVDITLRDSGVLVNGAPVDGEGDAGVHTAADIVYYEAGKDFTYGEGSAADAHTPEQAAAHTVVHITRPGTYRLSGTLSRGQIAVDLGEEAEEDPSAVVTLILDGADITCEVAPAVIFYNVYECGGTADGNGVVDTSAAGARVILADGAVNAVNGSYVARIYKPGTVVLNEDKTEVEDAKKLHKYDGAFYSRMSMNMDGEEQGTGVLNITAANEGVDSEMHLTLNGGNINITSGNDGINTNEDGVSVTTVNGGTLTVTVTGETGEGDGIDSNGWLVINGGTVVASACSSSADAGIDADLGIRINGGTVVAGGHMLDRIGDGGQTYCVFSFAEKQVGGEPLILKNGNGETVADLTLPNDCSVLIFSSPALKEGGYTLWNGETQLAGQQGGAAGGMMPPGGMEAPEGMERPDGKEPPEGMEWPGGMTPPEGSVPFEEGQRPQGQQPPEGMERPGGMGGEMPVGGGRWEQSGQPGTAGGINTEFRFVTGANQFASVAPVNEK